MKCQKTESFRMWQFIANISTDDRGHYNIIDYDSYFQLQKLENYETFIILGVLFKNSISIVLILFTILKPYFTPLSLLKQITISFSY